MFLKQSINDIISQDIYNLIVSLNHLYNINNLQLLLNRYLPNITINTKQKHIKKHTTKNRKKHSFHKLPHSNLRCSARCWGGKHSVKYNPITKKWTYGTMCKKTKLHNSKYCKIHTKQSLTSYGLTNGDFFESPPHPHYNKYKNIIKHRFNIKN